MNWPAICLGGSLLCMLGVAALVRVMRQLAAGMKLLEKHGQCERECKL